MRPDERHVLCVDLVRRTEFGRLHSNGHFASQPLVTPKDSAGIHPWEAVATVDVNT